MNGKRLNVPLLAGIFCLAAGTVGAGLTYRSMRTENLIHARTGVLSVPFADTPAAVSTRFQPYRDGVYRVYFALPASGADGCSSESLALDLARLDGIIDIAVWEPDGRVVLARSVGPGDAAEFRPGETGWILLDSVTVPAAPESSWIFELSYCPGTPFAPTCPWTAFLLPPQQFDIGEFLREGITLLLVFGGVMFSGFILIVAGGRKRA